MKTVKVQIVGTSPYSQSKPHSIPKLNKETAGAYEARTWHGRIHVGINPETGKEQVYCPPMAFRLGMAESARFLGIQIPGKGKSTYTKHFESGVLCKNNVWLYDSQGNPIVPPSENGLIKAMSKNDEAEKSLTPQQKTQIERWKRPSNEVWGDWVFVPSDGVAGSGKRVWKVYPMIDSGWQAELTFTITDDVITEQVFRQVLANTGFSIGIGRWRVRNRGNYGMFGIKSVKWEEIDFSAIAA